MKRILLSPTLIAAVCCALLMLALSQANAYWWDLAIRVGLNAMLAIAINLLVGVAGQISLGHAAFLGIGAYATAILPAHYGWSPLAAMAAGALVTGLLAWGLARLVLRLKGYYLAMATLGLGIITSIAITNESELSGGPDGISVPSLSIGSLDIAGEQQWFMLVAVLFLVTLKLARNLLDSPFGRSLRALHGSEPAASMTGIDVAKGKSCVFVISAVVASLVGSLFAHYLGFITPQLAGFLHSIELVTMVVIGGLGSFAGAIVGALILTVAPQFLANFEGMEMIFFGAVLIVAVVFFPRGIAPTIAARFKRPEA